MRIGDKLGLLSNRANRDQSEDGPRFTAALASANKVNRS